MIRNLRVLVAAALALAASGAFSATSAQAADEFHCSASPCKLTAKQDGTGATAHQVFIVENAGKTESVSFTCHEVSGEAEFSFYATTQVTAGSIAYNNCTVNGSPGVTVDMNGCDYEFTRGAAGNTAAGTEDKAEVHLKCSAGKAIQVTVPGGCTVEIRPQTVTGMGFHTVGATPNREITLTAKQVQNIAVTATAGCAALINPNQTLTGTYTTGNVIATGETTGGAMADAWFATHELHCSASSCKVKAQQDGTGATGHQVFIVHDTSKGTSVSFTCHEVSAEAEPSALTTTQITTSKVEYKTCTVNGSPGVTVDMNGCDYQFTRGAAGNDAAGTSDKAEVHVKCPAGKEIQVTVPSIGCTFKVGPQTLTGIGYQTVGTEPNREVTLTAKNVGGIAVTATAGCSSLIDPAGTLIGTYTTGNVLATGESPPTKVMADAWFANHEFHCDVSPCRGTAGPDGAGSTAHQIFIIENAAQTETVSLTCHGVSAEAEVIGKTASQVTATNIKYENCTFNGSPGLAINMNGCDYEFTGGSAGTADGAQVHIKCPAGKAIQISILGCVFEIAPQTLTGIGYQTVGTEPNREVTLTAKNVGGIAVTATAGCALLINPNQTLTGTLTTGNVIATGEIVVPEAMADLWFL